MSPKTFLWREARRKARWVRGFLFRILALAFRQAGWVFPHRIAWIVWSWGVYLLSGFREKVS